MGGGAVYTFQQRWTLTSQKVKVKSRNQVNFDFLTLTCDIYFVFN